MKWDHTDYTACNAHTALRFQKDVRWRARKNHRAFQMRRVRIGESRRQVSSWQLCYEERLFAAREVHGGVIPGQTSFLEPQVYSPCDPSSPLARVPSTARVLVHTCSGCTRLQPPFPSAPVGSSCIPSQRPPRQSPPGLATPALCNETGNLDGGTLGSFPIIASGSASVGNTTGYHWQLGTSWEPPVLLGSACLGFPSAVPFLHFWPFDHSCPPLFFFPFPSA